MYTITLKTDAKVYYIANSGAYNVSEDLQMARIFTSRSKATQAIDAYKKDFKHITRSKKTPLIPLNLVSSTPGQVSELSIDFNSVKFAEREVVLTISPGDK